MHLFTDYRTGAHYTVLIHLFSALLNHLIDVIRYFCSHRLIHDQLVKRRDLLATLWTNKVSLKKVSLDTFFAVSGFTARRFHGITK